MTDNNGKHRSTIQGALDLVRGAPVRGARFKLLMRQIDPTFNEKAEGFTGLRRFLDGYRDLVDVAHDGIDIVVSPAKEQHGASTPDVTRQLQLVRGDLWRAFAFIDPAVLRFYDRERGEALMLPRDPTSGESETVAALRGGAQSDATRFVSIPSITPDDQSALVKRFVGEIPQDHPRRSQLDSALLQPLWFRAFQFAIRGDRDMELRWKASWSAHVVQVIQAWAAEHGVTIPNVVTRELRVRSQPSRRDGVRSTSPPSAASPSAPTLGRSRESSDIRRKILRAVERLPLDQLLALPLPAACWLDED